MKRFLICSLIFVILIPTIVSAKSEEVRLTIINQTGEEIYIKINQYTFLTAKYIEPDFMNEKPTTVFTLERDRYQGVEIFACGAITTGDIDLTSNLKINFTPCEEMSKMGSRKYRSEPSMEKFNWQMTTGKANWRFRSTDVNILDASGTANYLKIFGCSAGKVGTKLRDGFRLKPQMIAQILKDTGFSPVEVGTTLHKVFTFSAKDVGRVMKFAGFTASGVYEALKSVFGLSAEDAKVALQELLFSKEEIFEVVIEELAVEVRTATPL